MAPVATLVVLLGARSPASGQPPSNQDVLAALLVEVRGLRAAIERMASAGPRVQLAFGRLQLEEQRLQTLIRRHTDVREQLASAEREAALFARQIEAMEEELPQITESDRRRSLERELPLLRERQKQMAVDLQRLRSEEVDLSQQIGTEQNRWIEISQALDDLERTLKR
jgi:predicted  nucleic acid-binding Zn-ribbon protein